MNTTESGAGALSRARYWQSPKLTMLGDVGSLTETGSMAANESPYNLCQQSINMVGNTCMG